MLERTHRQLYPEIHQNMCSEILDKMSKDGVANFVMSRAGTMTMIVAKVPRDQLIFFRIIEGPSEAPHQNPDGPWQVQAPNVSPDSILQMLPTLTTQCFGGKSTRIKQYTLSLADHKPPIGTVRVSQG